MRGDVTDLRPDHRSDVKNRGGATLATGRALPVTGDVKLYVVVALQSILEDSLPVGSGVTMMRAYLDAGVAHSIVNALEVTARRYDAMRAHFQRQPGGVMAIKGLIEKTQADYLALGFQVDDPETRWRVDEVPCFPATGGQPIIP